MDTEEDVSNKGVRTLTGRSSIGGKTRAHLAVKVEDAMAVIHGNGRLRDEPGGDLAVPYIEGWEVACDKQEELKEVVPNERIPQPAAERLLWL